MSLLRIEPRKKEGTATRNAAIVTSRAILRGGSRESRKRTDGPLQRSSDFSVVVWDARTRSRMEFHSASTRRRKISSSAALQPFE